MIYTPNIQKAIKFAAKTHNQYQQQTRKGKVIPYISHPLTVGMILSLAYAKEAVIVAGILHDTIEDSIKTKPVTREMIIERFGERVAELVWAVTEDKKIGVWSRRKAKALKVIENYDHEMLLLKSADIISNMRELLDDYQRYGDEVFEHFIPSKKQLIAHQLKVIGKITMMWRRNPLRNDLGYVREGLEEII